MQPRNDESTLIPRTLRELEAFADFMTASIGVGPMPVAEGVVELLLKTLGLDFAYLRLELDKAQGNVVEVARTIHGPTTEAQTEAIADALAPWIDGRELQGVRTGDGSSGDRDGERDARPSRKQRRGGCASRGIAAERISQRGRSLAPESRSQTSGDHASVPASRGSPWTTGARAWRTLGAAAAAVRAHAHRLHRNGPAVNTSSTGIQRPKRPSVIGEKRLVGKTGEPLLIPPAGREYTGEITVAWSPAT